MFFLLLLFRYSLRLNPSVAQVFKHISLIKLNQALTKLRAVLPFE